MRVCVGVSSSCTLPFWLGCWGVCPLARAPSFLPRPPFFFFEAWRSPAQDYTNLLNCEVPRRTRRILPRPLGGAACGVGLGGDCSGHGLPPLASFFFRLRGGDLWFSIVSRLCGVRRRLVLGPWLSVPFPFRLGCVFFFCRRWRATSLVGCAPACSGCPFPRPFGGRVVVVGHCFWLGVARLGWVVLRCSFGGPRGCRLWCCLAGGVARLLWSGCAAARWCDCLSPPPCFFLRWARVRGCTGVPPCPCVSFLLGGEGVSLLLLLPSLGCCTHWSAFGVANRVAVGTAVRCGPCPGPMCRVGYVRVWPDGLSCWVTFSLCRLGGCPSRFRVVLG